MTRIGAALLVASLLAGCCSSLWATSLEITPDGAEIVVAADASATARFAATELNGLLARALGRELPVVAAPSQGKVSIVLGDCALSREAGIDVRGLARDAFTIRTGENRVFIAGHDSAGSDPAKNLKQGRVFEHERATLFGVYEFLERFAGVRFYFPGDIGTVVPKRAAIKVPKTDLTRAPAFTVRNIYLQGDGAVPGDNGPGLARETWKALEWLRLRLQTTSVPCCHGQRGFDYERRFAKTHPEYFALLKDRSTKQLRRDSDPEHKLSYHSGQVCQSSKIWDEYLEDCRAYLSGAKAESRKIRSLWSRDKVVYAWNSNFKGKRFIDVMPQDGLERCLCENCAKRYVPGTQYATELIWENTAKLARTLSDEGFDCIITQMAYPPYRDIPKCELPSNVWVMVAESGPWNMAYPKVHGRDLAEVKGWSEKLGHKVWMWTYPHKFGAGRHPGIPDMAPRAWWKCYSLYAPYSQGAFCESECDKSIYHYLNYYVFAKLAWNPGLDIDALLSEHFRTMFGAAAGEMEAFYGELEEKWTRHVIKMTNKGGDSFGIGYASEEEVWAVIYNREVRNTWAALFDRAAKKLAPESDEAKRLAFIRAEFLAPIIEKGDAFDRETDVTAPRPAGRNLLAGQTTNIVITVDQNTPTPEGRKPSVSKRLQMAEPFEPNTEYRLLLEFELTCDDSAGAFYTDVSMGKWIWFPEKGQPTGHLPPLRRTYSFKTGDSVPPPAKQFILINLRGMGTVTVQFVSVTKVEGKK